MTRKDISEIVEAFSSSMRQFRSRKGLEYVEESFQDQGRSCPVPIVRWDVLDSGGQSITRGEGRFDSESYEKVSVLNTQTRPARL